MKTKIWALTDKELEAIRKRNTKDIEYTVPYQSFDSMTIHSLLREIDRLRRLDALARKWLKAEDDWLSLPAKDPAADFNALEEKQYLAAVAREAYRKALDEKR